MNTNKEITVNGESVIVRKIPLRKYADIIPALKNLTQFSTLFGDFSSEKIMEALPTLLIQAPDSIDQILSLITDYPAEAMKVWGLDDYVRVFDALFEVNDFAYIYQTLKKGMTHLNMKQPGIANLVDQASQTAPSVGAENPFTK